MVDRSLARSLCGLEPVGSTAHSSVIEQVASSGRHGDSHTTSIQWPSDIGVGRLSHSNKYSNNPENILETVICSTDI